MVFISLPILTFIVLETVCVEVQRTTISSSSLWGPYSITNNNNKHTAAIPVIGGISHLSRRDTATATEDKALVTKTETSETTGREEGKPVISVRGGGTTESTVRERAKIVSTAGEDAPRISPRKRLETPLSAVIARMEEDVDKRSRLASLVDFVVTASSGRQFYFLLDHTTPDLTWSVRKTYHRWGDLTIFSYDGDLTEVETSLMSSNHVLNLRNIIVICSPSHTVQIFRQVREKEMESASIHWFVILEEDVTKDILGSIREGTQISIALKGPDGRYLLSTSYVNKDNVIRLREVGKWSWSSTKGGKSFMKEPLYRPLSEVYRDFGGRLLSTAVVDNWPFFKVIPQPDGSGIPHSGIDYSVLNAVSSKLNFTYRMVIVEDGQWGGVQEDGTITGMIGMVARHDTDFAINEITITAPREVVVDFTTPYFVESTTLVSPAPQQKNRAFAVFSPFTGLVWMLVALATVAVGPILSIVRWVSEQYVGAPVCNSASDTSFNMFRSLVIQGNRLKAIYWSHRILIFTWYCFCFIVYALYAGTLTAVLAIPAYEEPIDSLWHLLDAVKNDGYKPVVVYATSNEFVFKEATSGIYKEVWDVFDPSVGYVNSWDAGVEKVLTGKYVFMNAHLGAEIRARMRGRHNYYFARNNFYPQGYGIACRSGSPYKDVFEFLLIQIMSAGLVGKWTRDEVLKVKSEEGASGNRPGAITLVHLQAAFFILAIGYSTATLVLLFEHLRSHKSMQILNQLSGFSSSSKMDSFRSRN